MKKIIIVDDDPALQDSIQLVFNPEEYAVTVFSGAQPILKNEFEIPDIFILDKQLSGTDGLDVCKHLKQHADTAHVPIIMLSASPSIIRSAENAGADAAVEKPFQDTGASNTCAAPDRSIGQQVIFGSVSLMECAIQIILFS